MNLLDNAGIGVAKGKETQKRTTTASPTSGAGLTTTSPADQPFFDKFVELPPGTVSKYAGVKVLGTGGYGEVWLVSETATSKKYVGKVLNWSTVSQRHKDLILSEIDCLQQCNHINIVRYVEMKEVGPKILLIMEYCEGGDLAKQLAFRRKAQPYSEQEALFILCQILLALDYLHFKKILHRDLKCANCLLTLQGLLKLGDFGFSRQYEETISDAVGKTFCGTSYYIAPEIWRHESYSKKADMYSLGILLYEILALARPFTGQDTQMVPNILSGTYPRIARGKYSDNLIDLCESLMSIDPQARPDTRAILTYPFIRQSLNALQSAISQPKLFPPEVQQGVKDSVNNALNLANEVEVLMEEDQSWYPNVPFRVLKEGGIQLGYTLYVPSEVADVVTKDGGVLELLLLWKTGDQKGAAAEHETTSKVTIRCKQPNVMENVLGQLRAATEAQLLTTTK
eukprot:PhF_6_TR12876/c1_g1_i1/m.20250/K08857/NEK1_4_5; NIMA (never in mitosis gene a)-related kinase 1/4/5